MKGLRPRGRAPWRAVAWIAGAALVFGCVSAVRRSLPDTAPLAHRTPTHTRYMELRDGAAGDLDPLPLDSISPFLACAVVKAEDRGYFRHGGVEWAQVRRAIGMWVTGSGTMGASTITQQLARNLYLGSDRTLQRKAREALIARRLESTLSKRRILEIYLNVVEWGEDVWGIEAASRHYLEKEAAELDAFESVFLASLLPAPRKPFVGANARRARLVQSRVAMQMYRSGLLDAAQWREVTARGAAVHDAIARGAPVTEALRAAPTATPPLLSPPPRAPGPGLSPAQALPGECGLAREVATEHALRGGSR